jgi:hypothetical protein
LKCDEHSDTVLAVVLHFWKHSRWPMPWWSVQADMHWFYHAADPSSRSEWIKMLTCD